MLCLSNQHKIREMSVSLKRKIVTAVLSSLVFTLILSTPDWFEGDGFFNLYYLNFMIVITYGVITSSFSDWISKKISKSAYSREFTSFIFHCLFGSILAVLGLISAILFFIVDRLLRKVKIGWPSVIISLSIVVLVFIFLMNR